MIFYRINLAAALGAQGKFEQVETESRAVMAVRQRVPGPEHPGMKNAERLVEELKTKPGSGEGDRVGGK